MVLDDLDRDLLRHLQDDARLSFRKLAGQTGSTVPTVSSRIRRLEALGIIQGYTVQLDPARFGTHASPTPAIDVGRPANVACHTCGRTTENPVQVRIGDRLHPFCCPTCRAAFQEKHDRHAEGL